MIDLIRKLVESYGPSGYEDQIRQIVLKEMKGLADEISTDALGNVIAWQRGGGKRAPRIMLSAHMDEIGMMVSYVDKEGFMRFTALGGLNANTLHGQRVRFADGTIGMIGVDSEVAWGDAPKIDQLFIDVGSGGKKHGIKVGDAAGMFREMTVNGSRLTSKTMDDRIGCAIQIEVMRAVRGKKLPNDVAFVFSVQEEVGLRGAKTAAHAVEPDLGIAIDVTRTGDTANGIKMDVALGKGPAIKIRDSGMLAAPEAIAHLEKAAKSAKVPVQREVLLAGTTDAAAMQLVRAGVRAGCVSIPCRYIHTTSETVDMKDVEGAIKLLAKAVELPVAT